MYKQDFFKQKIKAFLHDPPEKPFLLGSGVGHEAQSRKYIQILLGEDESFDKNEWAFADHVASAADRTSFPLDWGSFRVNFKEKPILTHPNAGHKFDLQKVIDIEPDLLEQNIIKTLEQIKNLSDNQEQKFLYLWRYFSELTSRQEEGHETLGLLWDYLPADTRIPDHSVLDHARIVSAFAGAGISNDKVDTSLLLFNIGPVQEFIAAARKTQDLWAGSYMLSWLSWQGMSVFCEALGPDSILFPDLKGQPLVDYWLKYEKGLSELTLDEKLLSAPTLPNRFFAVVPKGQAEHLAKEAENKVAEALLGVGKYTFEKLESVMPDARPDFTFWKDQLSNFLQCYWSALDLPEWNRGSKELNKKYKKLFAQYFKEGGDKQDYRDQIYKAYKTGGFQPNLGTFYGRFYEIIEKAVGGRKALRGFNQLEEPGYRCSLIPGLAALSPDGKNVKPKVYGDFWKEFYDSIQQNDNLAHELGKNERLSPLALTKRFFPNYLESVVLKEAKGFTSNHFNSTNALSVADFKLNIVQQLIDNKGSSLRDKVKDFIKAVDKFQEKLNLKNESPLHKIRVAAKEASIQCKIDTINFCALPGELFQPEYYEQYQNDLNQQHSDKNGIKNIAKDAKQKLSALIQEAGIQHPSKYYAILYLDGDNMGKWLSGDLAPEFWKVLHPEAVKDLIDGIQRFEEIEEDSQAKKYKGWKKIFEPFSNDNWYDTEKKIYKSKKRPQAPTQHMAISRALNNFSLRVVRKIVEEEFLGRLIYAGGDDVVAMVSLKDALPCAEKLRAAFSGHLQSDKTKDIDKLQITLQNKNSSSGYFTYKNKNKENNRLQIATTLGPEASASCGIAIAHYMYPLKQALADARKAEKYAKDKLGRDAFAVNVIKRSGESTLSGAKWRLDIKSEDEKLIANGILHKLGQAFLENKLSPKFIVDIEEILNVLVILSQKAVLAEIKRIYNQHNEGFSKYVKKKDMELEKDYNQRIQDFKNQFFEEVIKPLFDHCDELGDTDSPNSEKYKQQSGKNGKPDEWHNLKNAVKLMDMAYYIGKGGGR